MDQLLVAADVVVSRSGGTSVAELAIVGVPSVLVPFPTAPRDHQTANAQSLVESGAAVLVPDAELDEDRLAAELTRMLKGDVLVTMTERAHGLGRPDAADRVADLVIGSAT